MIPVTPDPFIKQPEQKRLDEEKITFSTDHAQKKAFIHYKNETYSVQILGIGSDLQGKLDQKDWENVAKKVALMLVKKNVFGKASLFEEPTKMVISENDIDVLSSGDKGKTKISHPDKRESAEHSTTQDYAELVDYISKRVFPTPLDKPKDITKEKEAPSVALTRVPQPIQEIEDIVPIRRKGQPPLGRQRFVLSAPIQQGDRILMQGVVIDVYEGIKKRFLITPSLAHQGVANKFVPDEEIDALLNKKNPVLDFLANDQTPPSFPVELLSKMFGIKESDKPMDLEAFEKMLVTAASVHGLLIEFVPDIDESAAATQLIPFQGQQEEVGVSEFERPLPEIPRPLSFRVNVHFTGTDKTAEILYRLITKAQNQRRHIPLLPAPLTSVPPMQQQEKPAVNEKPKLQVQEVQPESLPDHAQVQEEEEVNEAPMPVESRSMSLRNSKLHGGVQVRSFSLFHRLGEVVVYITDSVAEAAVKKQKREQPNPKIDVSEDLPGL